MGAESIEWHEQCLRNSIETHKQYHLRRLELAIEAERRIREHNEHYAKQIARAKKMKKKSFDAERFAAD